jgi:hypothetical protein
LLCCCTAVELLKMHNQPPGHDASCSEDSPIILAAYPLLHPEQVVPSLFAIRVDHMHASHPLRL